MKTGNPIKNKMLFLFVVIFVGLFFVLNRADALTISPIPVEISGDPGKL